MLNAGQQVILIKAAKGPHPTSYSLVTRYEGDNIWRTPFEAEDADEVYDFDIWHYTFSKDLSNNPRVSIYWVAAERYDDDYEDDDCEEDEYDTEEPPVRRSIDNSQAKRIQELEQQIWLLQHKELTRELNEQAKNTPKVQTWARRKKVSI